MRKIVVLKCFLLTALIQISLCQAEDNSQIYPCQAPVTNLVHSNASDTIIVPLNDTYCNKQLSRTPKAYVIHSAANVTNGSTVVLVAVRGRSLITWTLPFIPQSFITPFPETAHTLALCPVGPASIGPPYIYIDISTDSPTSLNYTLSVTLAENFELSLSTAYITNVTSTHPQVFYFEFPDNVEAVTVDLSSSSAACTSVSAQSTATCPPNDLLYNPLSKLIRQTMTTSAFLTVSKGDLDQSSFFLIIRQLNYSVCHTLSATVPEDTKEVKFTLGKLKPASLFSAAIIAPLGIFLLVFVMSCAVYSSCCCRRTLYWTPIYKLSVGETAYAFRFGSHAYSSETPKPPDTVPAVAPGTELKQGEGIPRSYGSLNDFSAVTRVEDPNTTVQPVESSSRPDGDGDGDPLTSSIFIKPDDMLRVPSLAKRDFDRMQLQYAVYAWNTGTVGIFYALPAFQLVLSQQLSLRTNGDEDQCYYNFKCAIPYGVLSAFNNVWSNVGYVLFGLAFISIITIREYKFRWLKRQPVCVLHQNGLPQYFGVYYAMGISLVMEGFMSAFYHICPSNANFQFDTAFMFIIGGLLLVKIFQNRHPDFHANAFAAFFSFAVVILFTLVGIYFDKSNPLSVRLFLLMIVLAVMSVFLFSLYYYHQWDHILRSLKTLSCLVLLRCQGCNSIELKKCFTPRRKVVFVKFLAVIILNFILAVIVIAARHSIGIATVILIFFLFNSNIFLVFYVFSKWYYREPWSLVCMAMVLLAGVSWIGALYFYFSNVSAWSLTPAESRGLNKSCILFGFYDNHDVWHFLSAAAMFFSFMFILTLDDGLENTPREEISIF